MRARFHNITPGSPARAAVRDVQDRVHSARLTRSSGMIMRRGLMGTQIQPLAQDTVRTMTAQAAGIPRWG
jgi:hypothetical protein